jgi:hypothetical protein
MKVVGPVFDVYTPARDPFRRKVEKASVSSRLKEEKGRSTRSARMNGPQKRDVRASRSETPPPDDAPTNGMPAGFIAQILGQVLATKRPDATVAARAYARSARSARSRFIRWA